MPGEDLDNDLRMMDVVHGRPAQLSRRRESSSLSSGTLQDNDLAKGALRSPLSFSSRLWPNYGETRRDHGAAGPE